MKLLLAIRNSVLPIRILKKLGMKAPGAISLVQEINSFRNGNFIIFQIGIIIDPSFHKQICDWIHTQGFKWGGTAHNEEQDILYFHIIRWTPFRIFDNVKRFLYRKWLLIFIASIISASPSLFDFPTIYRFIITFISVTIVIIIFESANETKKHKDNEFWMSGRSHQRNILIDLLKW